MLNECENPSHHTIYILLWLPLSPNGIVLNARDSMMFTLVLTIDGHLFDAAR